MNLVNVSGTLQMLAGWYNKAVKLGRVVGDNSLSDLTSQTKVEPLVTISKDCIGIEAMPDIMQGLLNYTIADYMQAVAIYGKIDDIKVQRALGAFNPNRDGSAGAMLASVSMESYSPLAMKFSLPMGGIPTMEAKNGPPNEKGAKFNTKELQEEAKNMSVGKLVDVEFVPASETQPKPITMPIQFRLLASYINSGSMVNMLTNGTDDTGFWSRFERARDGGISGFMDFIMAQDMIEEKRKLMYSDDGKVMQKIAARAAANKRAAIVSGVPSLANLSGIFIFTQREAQEISARLGRSLDSAAAREQIFRQVSAATLVIIDPDWSMATFWHRGLDTKLELEFKQLKAAGGSKGPDLMDMFRQFNMGMPIA